MVRWRILSNHSFFAHPNKAKISLITVSVFDLAIHRTALFILEKRSRNIPPYMQQYLTELFFLLTMYILIAMDTSISAREISEEWWATIIILGFVLFFSLYLHFGNYIFVFCSLALCSLIIMQLMSFIKKKKIWKLLWFWLIWSSWFQNKIFLPVPLSVFSMTGKQKFKY